MPFIADPVYNVTLALGDRDNNLASVPFLYSSALSIGSLITTVDTILVPAIAGISDAIPVSYTISLGSEDDTLNPATAAPETSDVERKGVFVFGNAGNSVTRFSVPSIKNTLVVDGTNIINLQDPLVQAFLAAILPGVPGSTTPISISGAAIRKLKGAPYKMHRGSSKG